MSLCSILNYLDILVNKLYSKKSNEVLNNNSFYFYFRKILKKFCDEKKNDFILNVKSIVFYE